MLSDRIKNARIKAGLSRKEAAERLDMPYTTYRNYEQGTREPKIETVKKIAKDLNTNEAELLGFEVARTPIDTDRAMKTNRQEAKHDKGKPRLSLVPQQIIYDIAEIREYGCEKYGDSENWRDVEVGRYIDAFYRHWTKFVENNDSTDEESGKKHLKHCACNLSFICEMLNKGAKQI